MSEHVTVAVRVRPWLPHEARKAVVKVEESTTELLDPRSLAIHRRFTFDHSFDSFTSGPVHIGQQKLFETLGEPLLNSAVDGYNVTVLAYGQTGSGKTHTMIGTPDDPGFSPRFAHALFERCDASGTSFSVEVSFIEIYMEQIRDLLNPSMPDARRGGGLRVREHPTGGPYVEDLSKMVCATGDAVTTLLDQGHSVRSVGATRLNAQSSRSHAILTLTLTQRQELDGEGGAPPRLSEKVSRVHLVDLAGSERSKRTASTGARLHEASAINKSLSALGAVISALASPKGGHGHVPYRDSALTWLLKDGLGGNARTAMLAAVSPAAADFAETLSTLRYADSAKQILTHAKVNLDPNARLITDLKTEIGELKAQLARMSAAGEAGAELERVREQLLASEKLQAEAEMSWEERLRSTEMLARQRELMLATMHGQMELLERQLADAERARLAAEAQRKALEQRLATTASAAGGAGGEQPDGGSDDEMPPEFASPGAQQLSASRAGGAPVWYSVHDFDGEIYFWNPSSGETSWDEPEGAVVLAAAPGTVPGSSVLDAVGAQAAPPGGPAAPSELVSSDDDTAASDSGGDELPAEFRSAPARAAAQVAPDDSPQGQAGAPTDEGATDGAGAPSRARRASLTSVWRGSADADSDDEVDPHFLSRVLTQLEKRDRSLASLRIQLEQAQLMLDQEESTSLPEPAARARARKWRRAAASLRAAVCMLSPAVGPGARRSAVSEAGDCLHEGWLLKVGRDASAPHRRRRWFVLKVQPSSRPATRARAIHTHSRTPCLAGAERRATPAVAGRSAALLRERPEQATRRDRSLGTRAPRGSRRRVARARPGLLHAVDRCGPTANAGRGDRR